MQGIVQVFHTCDSHMHDAALFQNIFKFCTFLHKFSNILPFFCLFFALFLRNLTHALTFQNRPCYGNPIFDENDNQEILEISIRYILDSERFSGALMAFYTICLPQFAITVTSYCFFIYFHFHFLFLIFSLAENEY